MLREFGRYLPPPVRKPLARIWRRVNSYYQPALRGNSKPPANVADVRAIHADLKLLRTEVASLRAEVRNLSRERPISAPPVPMAPNVKERSGFDAQAVVKWLVELRESGVKFVFPEALEHTLEEDDTARAILKHDIHHNLDRAVELARLEHNAGIAGLFFMMGPHELNAKFYDNAKTWDQLREIQSLGHRLGLHVDVIDSILRRQDLYSDLTEILTRFSSEGLTLTHGNSHGNTRFKSLGTRGLDFFSETVRPLKAPADIDAEGRTIFDHLGRYSLKELGDRFGIHYWVDSQIFQDGARLKPTTYVTDNSRSVTIPVHKLSSKKFELDESFVAESKRILSKTDSLILLHPQWHISVADTEVNVPKDSSESLAASTQVTTTQSQSLLPTTPKEHFDPLVFEDIKSVDPGDQEAKVDMTLLKDGFRYDVRLNRRKPADHLIVALHGGVRGAKVLPVLARWTQHTYFQAPILSVFDPLVYKCPNIPGGWFVGDLDHDATAVIADLVSTISQRMNIPKERVVFLGNSSGGFAAVRLAVAIGGARFVSINGQTRIIDYYQSGYGPFSEAFDPTKSPIENATQNERRWSTVPTLKEALASGVDVRGVIIQNANDEHHFEKHYKPFCAALELPPEGGLSHNGKLRAVPYEGEKGHGPEPADIARRITKEFIPELLAGR